MALNEFQQFKQLADSSQQVLALFNSKDTGDALSSALALKNVLEKQHKQVDIVSADYVIQKNLDFLPGAATVKSELAHLQKFIIKVDVSKNPVDSISYDVKDDTLSIYLTPKSGLITRHELRTAQSTFKYDLIIALGVSDLESLGPIYHNNTDLFYRTPIINIDCQPANEYYGQVNLVNLEHSSVAETVYRLIENAYEPCLDKTVATALLSGLTIATKSFKNSNVTPATLKIASDLISHGAQRDLIVKHLYHTRPLSALKLWGQALGHLKHDSSLGLVWTSLSRADFDQTAAAPADLHGLVDELINNAPEAKIVVIFYEPNSATNQIGVIVNCEKFHDSMKLVSSYHPTGDRRAACFFVENKTLAVAEQEIINEIKQKIQQ